MKKRKKGKRMVVTKSTSCINCLHNGGTKCAKPPTEFEEKNYPKVYNCSDWEFTPLYEYESKSYYGKFHTED